MAKSSTTYVCRECGGESLRWAGQCPHCRAWNTLEEFAVRRPVARHAGRGSATPGPAGAHGSRPTPVTEVDDSDAERVRLDWSELNRVLGGGLVRGSVTLVGGEPGVGKSTLLMHVSDQLARAGHRVLYASGEESARQVRMRAGRLDALHSNLLLLSENDLDAIVEATRQDPPGLLIVDSIQTVFDPAVDASPGTVTQVRESAARLLQLAKSTGMPVVLVGHVTKEGAIAGPRVLEHMVDTVLYLEGERRQEHRILRANKNRFGSTEEIGVFAMGERGMEEVGDPSAMLLAEASLNSPGTVAVPVMEGTRPLLVELQSLTATSGAGFPRRTATGIDVNRLHMLLAVIEQRARVRVSDKDVYVNVAGGLRIPETSADLAVALSVAGNICGAGVGDRTVVVGEIGLTGEVRRVTQMERRLQEAARRGFSRAIIPRLAPGQPRPEGVELVEVREVAQAIEAAFGGRFAAAQANGRRQET